MSIGEWRLAAGDSLFGPRLILVVISLWFKATAVVRCYLRETCINIIISCHGLRLSGFFQVLFFLLWVRRLRLFVFAVSSQTRPWSYCARISRFPLWLAGSVSLGFLLRWWQSSGRKTEKVGRGCGMHEMKMDGIAHSRAVLFFWLCSERFLSFFPWMDEKRAFFLGVVVGNELCYQRVWRWVT